MTLQLSYTSDLQVRSDKETVDLNFFNRRYLAIFNALTTLDGRQIVFDGVVNTFVTTALQQLNDLLGPLLTQIQSAATLGFLWAKAIGNPISLVNGQAEGFRVTDNASLFTPTPVLMVQDLTDNTNWGLVTLDDGGWTPSTGDLATHCIYCTKTQASTQWFISDSAAIFPAMNNVLAQTQTARDQAVAAQTSMAANIATMNALVAQVQSGPVVSVAGKTGAVTLVEGDVGGLVSDLAAKATTSSVTTLLAGKQDASAKLATLAGMTWAASQLLMATSTSALATLPITTFMQGRLADATAAAHLTGLGVSAFIQTLLDDADQPTAQTTLGIPAKAAGTDVIAGIDDVKFVTSLGAASAYRSLQWAAAQTTGFTLGSTFAGKIIPWTSASAGTITLANNAPAGTQCMVVQEGAGQITFAAQSGGTVQSRGARLKSNAQYAVVTALVYTNSGGTNAAWRLGGDLVA